MTKVSSREVTRIADEFVTLTEAAAIRGVSREAIHALIRRGRLDSIKAFGRLLLYRQQVENFTKGKPGPVCNEAERRKC